MKVPAGSFLGALCLLFSHSVLAQSSSSEADSVLTAKYLIGETTSLCSQANCCANKKQTASMLVVLQYLLTEGKIKSTPEVDLFLKEVDGRLGKCAASSFTDVTTITIGGVKIYSKPPTVEEKMRAFNSWSQGILVDGKLPEVLGFEDQLVLNEFERTFTKLDSSFKQNPAPALKLLAVEPSKFLTRYGDLPAGEIQKPGLELKDLRVEQKQAGGGGGGG